MKIKIEKKDLLNLISRSQNIVEKRNTMPILVNVLLDAKDDELHIFATNLEVSLTDHAPAQIDQGGKVAVNAKSLFDIVKELPDGMLELFRMENNWLRIRNNKSIFNIVGISPDEYPVFPTFEASEYIEMETSIISEMIEKTIYSVSNDETRYHLNGVYLEQMEDQNKKFLRMVATDGHRLSLVSREYNKDFGLREGGVIIPRKGLQEVRKLIENNDGRFRVAIEGSQLIVNLATTTLMIRLIEGKYPNYKQLIPQNLSEQLLLHKETLLSSLKRVSLLSNQKSKGVTLNLSSGRLEITSNNPELGDAKEEMDIEYTGKDMKIGFNAKYILDVLSTVTDEQVSLELKDQLSPGLVRPKSDKEYTCVIMPMRI